MPHWATVANECPAQRNNIRVCNKLTQDMNLPMQLLNRPTQQLSSHVSLRFCYHQRALCHSVVGCKDEAFPCQLDNLALSFSCHTEYKQAMMNCPAFSVGHKLQVKILGLQAQNWTLTTIPNVSKPVL